MDAQELRKKLHEGLKVDSSGKSTPIQRLTPFLNALVDYLEEHGNVNVFQDQETWVGTLDEDGKFVGRKVSSDDATQRGPASSET